MNELNIAEIMEAAKAKAHDQLVDAAVQSLKDNLAYTTGQKISEAVLEFFNKEIQPELSERLMAQKPELLAAVSAAITAAGAGLAEKMMERLTKKVREMDNYQVRKVFEDIF
jgi:hypothetical protein